MAKPVIIDGVPHRMRRGKLVPIPAEWFMKVPFSQNIKKRPSKGTRKSRTGTKRVKTIPNAEREDK